MTDREREREREREKERERVSHYLPEIRSVYSGRSRFGHGTANGIEPWTEMKNGNITVNGTLVMFRGVNRHDHHPKYGRAVPLSFIREDLRLMKRHNMNAVRCSHYPVHPELYNICDELGLWVMDEADLECHGFYDAVARPMELASSMGYEERTKLTSAPAAESTSNNPAWKDAYLDRMNQMVQRDKNHACVVIWSLGNESSYGQNHKAMYDYVREVDPSRPVHYDGDVEADSVDMFSYMYPSLDRLVSNATSEGDSFSKPIVLCEYGHAMGNAPGAFEEYTEAFRTHRRLQGGWIWEWANHGLWDDAQRRHCYGGDFGDTPNDGSFVMDGLCFSDHTPGPGMAEVRRGYAPVRAWVEGDRLVIENEYNFIGLDHLRAVYTLEAFGEKYVLTLRYSYGKLTRQTSTALQWHLGYPNHRPWKAWLFASAFQRQAHRRG